MSGIFSNFSTLDIGILLVFLLFSVLSGIYYAFSKDANPASLKQAFTGRASKWSLLSITLSIFSTNCSSIFFLGIPAEFYTRGIQYLCYSLGIAVAIFVSCEFFLPVLYRLGEVSMLAYLDYRFASTTLRLYFASTFVTTLVMYCVSILVAPSLAVSYTMNLPVKYSILIVGFTCTFYTAFGGLAAVIWNDVIQSIVMLIAITIILVNAVFLAGGLPVIWATCSRLNRLQQSFNWSLSPYTYQSIFGLTIGIFMLTVNAYSCSQQTFQRYLALDSLNKAKMSAYLVIPIIFLLLLILGGIGLAILTFYHNNDPLYLGKISSKDQLLPYFIVNELSASFGILGIFILCLLCGAFTSLSSIINSLSLIIWHDIISPFLPKCFKRRFDKSPIIAVQLTKLISVIIGCIIIVLALFQSHKGSLNTALKFLNVFSGQAVAVFFAGLYAPFIEKYGIISGKVVADIICIWLTYGRSTYFTPPAFLPTDTQFSNTSFALNNEATTTFIANSTDQVNVDLLSIPFSNFYSISYLFTSIIGFFTCLLISSIISKLLENYTSIASGYPSLKEFLAVYTSLFEIFVVKFNGSIIRLFTTY